MLLSNTSGTTSLKQRLIIIVSSSKITPQTLSLPQPAVSLSGLTVLSLLRTILIAWTKFWGAGLDNMMGDSFVATTKSFSLTVSTQSSNFWARLWKIYTWCQRCRDRWLIGWRQENKETSTAFFCFTPLSNRCPSLIAVWALFLTKPFFRTSKRV